jgi:hypothetical protein
MSIVERAADSRTARLFMLFFANQAHIERLT